MVAGREGGRRRHRRRDVPLRARARPGPRCWSGPTARPSGRCPAAASRARSTSWARRSSASGAPVLQRYGVSDDDAFAVGLTCGGILDVFVETVSQETFPELGDVSDDIEAGRPVAVATVIDHPDPAWVGRRLVVRPEADADRRVPTGSLGSPRADAAVTDDARGLLAAGRTETLTYGPDGERRGEGLRVFVAAYAPRPADARLRRHRLRGGRRPRRRVPRLPGDGVRRPPGVRHGLAASRPPTRWSSSGRTATWPPRSRPAGSTRRTVVCVLTHDPKFDVPLLEVALRMPEVAYVGAMGSRRTHDDRLERLREAGHHRRRAGAAVRRRSGSTSAPARRRRPRCRSPPRSSPSSGVAAGRGCRRPAARSTTTPVGRGFLTGKAPGLRFRADRVEPLVARVTSGEDHEHVTVHTCSKESTMTRVNVTVDGVLCSDDIEPRTLLVQYLRDTVGKVGTVVGCDTSNCGACTVHLDGRSVKSCNVLAVQADGARGHHDRGHRRRAASCTRCSRPSTTTTPSSAATARRG